MRRFSRRVIKISQWILRVFPSGVMVSTHRIQQPHCDRHIARMGGNAGFRLRLPPRADGQSSSAAQLLPAGAYCRADWCRKIAARALEQITCGWLPDYALTRRASEQGAGVPRNHDARAREPPSVFRTSAPMRSPPASVTSIFIEPEAVHIDKDGWAFQFPASSGPADWSRPR